jgi:hypothetical protein
MEGATSRIENAEKGWVRKTLKKQAKKSKIHQIPKQLEIQQWSASILTPAHGFEILFTPKARVNVKDNSYLMEKIDDSSQITRIEDSRLEEELVRYFSVARKAGYMPSDFELYEQPNKKVALLDFDKYGIIELDGKHVTYPYLGKKTLKSIPREALYSEGLHEKLKNSMKGGKRKTRKQRRSAADGSV